MRTISIGRTVDRAGGAIYNGELALGAQGNAVDGTAIGPGQLTIAVGDRAAVQIQDSVAGPEKGQSDASAYAKAQAINSSGVSRLTATANTSLTVAFSTVNVAEYSLKINEIDIYTDFAGNTTNISIQDFVQAVNANAASTGVIATSDGTNVTLTAADGRDIRIQQDVNGANSGVGLQSAAGLDNNVENLALDFG